jgi:3-methyladenine DNA glycosylase AlkD
MALGRESAVGYLWGMTDACEALRRDLRERANAADAVFLQRFFKTGPGEYGEGDRFLGVRVPAVRAVVRQHWKQLMLADVLALLRTGMHEERLAALLILNEKYRRGVEAQRAEIYQAYLDHTALVNNWDLVDSSAEHIVGAHLSGRSRRPLRVLAKSKSLWQRRIAIIATFRFIKQGEFDPTLAIAEMLVGDREDLIHKAVGWMLREVGKRARSVEEGFLKKHVQHMPRTMLRYAIEKFPQGLRQRYLRGEVGA